MVSESPSVLIVDDEAGICDLLDEELSERGCRCGVAYDGRTAISELAARDYDIALLDIRLPDISGMDVLRWIRDEQAGTAAVMITAVSNVDVAVEAMKIGARDYIVKPFDVEKIYYEICDMVNPGSILPCPGNRTGLSGGSLSAGRMDAIARGVEARLEEVLGYSRIVTGRTVEVARQLGMEDEDIMEWVANRLNSERLSGTTGGLSPAAARRSLLARGIASAVGQQLRYPDLG